ncbi:MAG: hypothetical protein IT388_07315 [Nitrospirales bacterium]|nr:hypothetical protein [Nitrospirales bacterium]
MEDVKTKLLCGAVSSAGGLWGMASLPHCAGGSCPSCFGCAGAGIALLLLVLVQKIRRAGLQEERKA